VFNIFKKNNILINAFEKASNYCLNKTGLKLKLSDLLRIVLAKVVQSENYRKKTTINIAQAETQDDHLPHAFNLVLYKELNCDLANLNDDVLRMHYEQLGRNDGRLCSAINSRDEFINVISRINGKRLEIGPYMSPLLKKDANTYFTDYFSTDELRREAIKDKRNPDKVVAVDFPSKGLSFKKAIGEHRFSIVVSCHCVEHVPCLITHFQEVSSIMSAGGYYFLIIPDKRFMADHYQETSILPEVLAAYAEQRKTTNIENTLKGIAFVTHPYPGRHWLHDHGDNPYLIKDKEVLRALEQAKQFAQLNQYSDQHCWRFTPQSFHEIMERLKVLEQIDLKIARVYPTVFGSGEFYVVLQKNA
jgi:hypothetical protein